MNFFKTILKNESFYKNVSKLLSANFIVQVIAFALSPIISRLYSPSDFGHLAIFMSVAGFFIVFASSRFELAIILPTKDDDANALVKLSFILNFIVSILSFIIVFYFKDVLSQYYKVEFDEVWLYLLPFTVFFSTSYFILINYHNRHKNYNKQAVGQAVLGISNPLSTIALAAQNGFQFGMIKAVLISNALASFIFSPVLFKNKVFQTKTKISTVLKKYYRFPVFNLPHALLNFLSNSLPVFILTPAFGEISIGLFSMALGKVFKPLNMFGGSIYQVLSKNIVDDIQNKKAVSSQVLKLIKTMALIGILPFIVLFILSPQLFAFIWGEEWRMSGVYLRYLLPWLFLVYLTSAVSFLPNVLKQQKGALKIEIIYFILRFIVLSYGVKSNKIETALMLYSFVGLLVLSFSLFWYISILKKVDFQNSIEI